MTGSTMNLSEKEAYLVSFCFSVSRVAGCKSRTDVLRLPLENVFSAAGIPNQSCFVIFSYSKIMDEYFAKESSTISPATVYRHCSICFRSCSKKVIEIIRYFFLLYIAKFWILSLKAILVPAENSVFWGVGVGSFHRHPTDELWKKQTSIFEKIKLCITNNVFCIFFIF